MSNEKSPTVSARQEYNGVVLEMPDPFTLDDYVKWRKALDKAREDVEHGDVPIATTYRASLSTVRIEWPNSMKPESPPLDVVIFIVDALDRYVGQFMDPKKMRPMPSMPSKA